MEPQFYGIDEWCKLHRISRGTWYNLVKTNKAPTFVKVGTRILISKRANDVWVRSLPKG